MLSKEFDEELAARRSPVILPRIVAVSVVPFAIVSRLTIKSWIMIVSFGHE